jgi:hypothetical protein
MISRIGFQFIYFFEKKEKFEKTKAIVLVGLTKARTKEDITLYI